MGPSEATGYCTTITGWLQKCWASFTLSSSHDFLSWCLSEKDHEGKSNRRREWMVALGLAQWVQVRLKMSSPSEIHGKQWNVKRNKGKRKLKQDLQLVAAKQGCKRKIALHHFLMISMDSSEDPSKAGAGNQLKRKLKNGHEIAV